MAPRPDRLPLKGSDDHRPESRAGIHEGPNHMNGAARLLTADDLSARWQVPASQVYRLARSGSLPTVKLGRYYRFALDEIEAFERGGGGDTDA